MDQETFEPIWFLLDDAETKIMAEMTNLRDDGKLPETIEVLRLIESAKTLLRGLKSHSRDIRAFPPPFTFTEPERRPVPEAIRNLKARNRNAARKSNER